MLGQPLLLQQDHGTCIHLEAEPAPLRVLHDFIPILRQVKEIGGALPVTNYLEFQQYFETIVRNYLEMTISSSTNLETAK